MSGSGERFPGIDAIKVAGIVTIVLIHALPPPWDATATPLERWLHQLTRFGVPGFLFASGFLYAPGPADLATTRRRLRRILVPYLIASLLAQLWHLAHGATLSEAGGVLGRTCCFGSSFGPYYYVFVIAVLVALTPVRSRACRADALRGDRPRWSPRSGAVDAAGRRLHARLLLAPAQPAALVGLLRARLDAAPARAAAAPRGSRRAAPLSSRRSRPRRRARVRRPARAPALPRLLARSAAWLDVYAILA